MAKKSKITTKSNGEVIIEPHYNLWEQIREKILWKFFALVSIGFLFILRFLY